MFEFERKRLLVNKKTLEFCIESISSTFILSYRGYRIGFIVHELCNLVKKYLV